MLKFRDIYCDDTSYVFKEFDQFNYDELLKNLLKKKKIRQQTKAREE